MGINLGKFSSGSEFTDVLTNYIQDEINNAKVKGESSAKDYEAFADTAWFGNIKPTWVPYLVDNNMLTDAQKDSIEANITRWKDVAEPGTNWILYIGIALVVIVIVLLIVIKRKPKKKPVFEGEEPDSPTPSGESKPE